MLEPTPPGASGMKAALPRRRPLRACASSVPSREYRERELRARVAAGDIEANWELHRVRVGAV